MPSCSCWLIYTTLSSGFSRLSSLCQRILLLLLLCHLKWSTEMLKWIGVKPSWSHNSHHHNIFFFTLSLTFSFLANCILFNSCRDPPWSLTIGPLTLCAYLAISDRISIRSFCKTAKTNVFIHSFIVITALKMCTLSYNKQNLILWKNKDNRKIIAEKSSLFPLLEIDVSKKSSNF